MIVREQAGLPAAVRIHAAADVNHAPSQDEGFCTWPELTELAHSGHVTIAAHGCTHRRLDRDDVDLHTEIVAPQALLSNRLGQSVDSFVFPYGRFSPPALRLVNTHYRHAFRIGGALNYRWDHSVTYRVDADGMKSPTALFTAPQLMNFRARHFWNRLRGR